MRRPQKSSLIQVQTLSELPAHVTKETMEKDQIFCLYPREQLLKIERTFLFCLCVILHSKQNEPVFFLVFNFLFCYPSLHLFLSPDVYLSFISIFPVSHVTDSYLSQLSVLQILENSVGATWVEWNLEKKQSLWAQPTFLEIFGKVWNRRSSWWANTYRNAFDKQRYSSRDCPPPTQSEKQIN